jgi:hypothetical protein
MRGIKAAALVAAVCVGACGSGSKAHDTAACEVDLKTLETAEEAYYAVNNTYGTYAQLIATQFASDPGTNDLHTVNLISDGTSYTLTATGKNDCNANYP